MRSLPFSALVGRWGTVRGVHRIDAASPQEISPNSEDRLLVLQLRTTVNRRPGTGKDGSAGEKQNITRRFGPKSTWRKQEFAYELPVGWLWKGRFWNASIAAEAELSASS